MRFHPRDITVAPNSQRSVCLSLGARYVAFDADILDPLLLQAASPPRNDAARYCCMVFDVSFKPKDFALHSLAPHTALLCVQLDNGYKAFAAAPTDEKDIVERRIKYRHGARHQGASRLEFKLGWSPVTTTVAAGDSFDESYSVLLETEASLETATVTFRNPLTDQPEWKFGRSHLGAVLDGMREVWVIVEAPQGRRPPLTGKATLAAGFTAVKEVEHRLARTPESQVRLLKKVFAAGIRAWGADPALKVPLEMSLDFPFEETHVE